MGLFSFDQVTVECIYCEKPTRAQTKLLGDCKLDNLIEGDIISKDIFADCILELKSNCEHCNNKIRLVISNKEIIKTTKNKPDYIETDDGEYMVKDEDE